jgi:predicted aspartyl protease
LLPSKDWERHARVLYKIQPLSVSLAFHWILSTPLETIPTIFKFAPHRWSASLWSLIVLLVGMSLTEKAMASQPRPIISREETNQWVKQVQQCVAKDRKQRPKPNTEQLQQLTTRCMFNVVVLNPDGTVRPDASDRLSIFLTRIDARIPQAKAQGQATLPLKVMPDTALFSVPVTLNGKTFPFVLDTGASTSFIDQKLGQKLGLKGNPLPTDLMGYLVIGRQYSQSKAALYSLPPVSVGKAKVSPMMGIGLNSVKSAFKTEGVLGLDFLSKFDLVIKPNKPELALLPISSPVTSGLPLKGSWGVMTTPIYVNGQGPYVFLIDTGASVTAISTKLVNKLNLNLQQAEKVEVLGFGGLEQGKLTTLDQLAMQQHQLSKVEAVAVESQVFQTLGIDGVVGQNVLNRYEQHWRFGPPGALGLPDHGSLELTAIPSKKP